MTLTHTPPTTSRYLQDNFAPVTEELTAVDLDVTGTLPEHLDGRYLRIGPNPTDEQGAALPLVPRRGDGARRPPARRPGPVVPQPLGPLRRRRHHARRAGQGHPRRVGLRGQHQRPRARRPHARARRGRLPAVRADPRARHRRALRLRRHPAEHPRPPGYTAHPHEDPDTGELHAISYSWMRGNRVDYSVLDTDRTDPAQRGHHGPRQPDDARLRPHRAPRRGARPAGHLRPRRGHLGRAAAAAPARAGRARTGHRSQPGARADDRPDRPRRRGRRRSPRCPTAGTPTTPPASASWPATPTATRSAGSTSTRASSSTPSTRTTTGDTVVVDVVKHPRMFATVLDRSRRGPGRALAASPSTWPPAGPASRASTSGRRSSRATTSD